MTMDYLNLFSYAYLAQHSYVQIEWVCKRSICIHIYQRQIINFEAVRQVAYTHSLVVLGSDYYYMVASYSQTLGYVVHMHFYTTKIWDKEIGNNRYVHFVLHF